MSLEEVQTKHPIVKTTQIQVILEVIHFNPESMFKIEVALIAMNNHQESDSEC